MMRLIRRRSPTRKQQQQKRENSAKYTIWRMKVGLNDEAHSKKIVEKHYINFITVN